MNILLTGATGYLGSHLAKAFVAEGHRVVALKRRTSSLQRLAEVQDKLCLYDIDSLNLARPFEEHGPIDAVVHTSTCYGRAGETPMAIFNANTVFPLRLLEAATSFNTATFFNTDTILYRYLNPYALSKKQFTEWGRQFSLMNQIRFVNIRLEHMYGPGDDSSKFTTWIIQQCLANVPEIKLTPGEQRRDFIYIDDVVAAYSALLKHAPSFGEGFQKFGLGSGHPVQLRTFVEMVHRLTSSSSKLVFGARPYRDHELMESQTGAQRLLDLGWRCRTNLETGLRKMIGETEQ